MEATWDKVADVVVIGSGASGLSAALVGLDPATARNLVEDMLKIARG